MFISVENHFHLLGKKKTVFTLNVFQVEGLVQGDSRIDQYPKVVNGESRIVWEWQGNCFLLELISD